MHCLIVLRIIVFPGGGGNETPLHQSTPLPYPAGFQTSTSVPFQGAGFPTSRGAVFSTSSFLTSRGPFQGAGFQGAGFPTSRVPYQGVGFPTLRVPFRGADVHASCVPFRRATSWIAPPAAVSPHSGMSSQGVRIPLQQTGPSALCTPQQFPCYGLTQQQFNATGAQQRFTATGEISQQAQHLDGDSSGETSVAVKKQKMDPQYMTERKLGSEVEYHCMHAALLSAWVTDSTVIVAWSY